MVVSELDNTGRLEKAKSASAAPIQSADVKVASQASVWQRDPEAAIVPATVSSDAQLTSKTAKTRNADAAVTQSSMASTSRYHVQSIDSSYEIFGVDAIWHNQYAGPETDFVAFRKQYHCDINVMVLLVARHVEQGLYGIISMNATSHMLTVICGCEKMRGELPEDMWDDPVA